MSAVFTVTFPVAALCQQLAQYVSERHLFSAAPSDSFMLWLPPLPSMDWPERMGLAYLPEDQVKPYIADGSLIRALADWCPPFSGYHLYYPSHRQHSPTFALLVKELRY